MIYIIYLLDEFYSNTESLDANNTEEEVLYLMYNNNNQMRKGKIIAVINDRLYMENLNSNTFLYKT